MRVRVIALALVALAALSPTALAAEQSVTLAEIEEEVMCPVCGTLLQLAEAPQAQREKAFISRLIAEGKSEEQIKDALVAEYGREVLATPPTTGSDAASWAVPVGLALLALVGLGLTARRWRRAGETHEAPQTELPEEDAKRLERDMAGYDL